jgi:hypothetical protein
LNTNQTEQSLATAIREIAGRGIQSRTMAKSHLRAIAVALGSVADPEVQAHLRSIEAAIIKRWGTADGSPSGPEELLSITAWLRQRANSKAAFELVKECAKLVLLDIKSMRQIRSRAFAILKLRPQKSTDSRQLAQWLLDLGIVVRIRRGVYRPGPAAANVCAMTWPIAEAQLRSEMNGEDG